ncbi:MAG: ABC transporter ATP-binding protein [Thermoproteales archaeon]|nr:ABC transporter ATP-binding protein [Thermoproteales archaeon]
MGTLLEVRNLKTYFHTRKGIIHAVDDVSFTIKEGEVFGLVGESGCGKSMTALSILRLVPFPGKIVGGEILFRGKDLLKMDEEEIRKIRGRKISMIFQDPNTSLNPVFKVGDQVDEIQYIHFPQKALKEIKENTIRLFKKVGIAKARIRRDEYPHEFSGGMKQRTMVSMSIANIPDLLIADEPTTALDVTVQARLIRLLLKLKEEYNLSILLITHNLGLVAETCDRVAVMYSGKIIEESDVYELFDNPLHPYTKGLLNCIPRVDRDIDYLQAIKGYVPENYGGWNKCMFFDRCDFAFDRCKLSVPNLKRIRKDHKVRCFIYE